MTTLSISGGKGLPLRARFVLLEASEEKRWVVPLAPLPSTEHGLLRTNKLTASHGGHLIRL